MRALLLAILTVLAPAAFAAPVIYKCVADNGKVTYSESPCYGENWHRFGAPDPKPGRDTVSEPAATPQRAPKSTERPRVVKLPTPP
jgi:uncharacterized protein DUF4124